MASQSVASQIMTTAAKIQYQPLWVPGSNVEILQCALKHNIKHDTAKVHRIAIFVIPVSGLFVPHSGCSLF